MRRTSAERGKCGKAAISHIRSSYSALGWSGRAWCSSTCPAAFLVHAPLRGHAGVCRESQGMSKQNRGKTGNKTGGFVPGFLRTPPTVAKRNDPLTSQMLEIIEHEKLYRPGRRFSCGGENGRKQRKTTRFQPERQPDRLSSIALKAFDISGFLDKHCGGERVHVTDTGGGRGIRTLDRTLWSYNGLANRRLQPLGHPSGVILNDPNLLATLAGACQSGWNNGGYKI